jgi:pimeloyl-ACP methyl ester carboxylesterase
MLFHRLSGDGEPLLLLNGIAMSVPSWEEVSIPLGERFKVIRCDFRGQLLSPGDPPAEVMGHVVDLVELLDHLGEEAVHVVGTSFGGVIGTLLAARHPERVRSLISIAAADGFDEQMAGEVARWRDACRRSLDGPDRGHLSDILEPIVYSGAFRRENREMLDERRRQVSKLPDRWFEDLIGLLSSAHSMRLRDELAAIRCPTFVLAAELDGFVPLARARGLADAIVGARFDLITGAGHAVVVEQPQAIVERFLEFLADHAATHIGGSHV